jgi:putative transcriptional regulator
MNIKPGSILVSTPALQDENFYKVVIVIAEYNTKGAMGFIVNKPFTRVLNELVEFSQSKPFTLYVGGPVAGESLFFIHALPHTISGGTVIEKKLYLGGDFKQTLACINHMAIPEKDIKLFMGYCGWDYGQLETEVEEGSWLIADADSTVAFSMYDEMLWQELYKRAK